MAPPDGQACALICEMPNGDPGPCAAPPTPFVGHPPEPTVMGMPECPGLSAPAWEGGQLAEAAPLSRGTTVPRVPKKAFPRRVWDTQRRPFPRKTAKTSAYAQKCQPAQFLSLDGTAPRPPPPLVQVSTHRRTCSALMATPPPQQPRLRDSRPPE